MTEVKMHILAAIDKWLESGEGNLCKSGTVEGIYLETRLRRAFEAGWLAKKSVIDAKDFAGETRT